MAKCAHNPSTMELGLALGSLRDLSPETTWRITVQEARCPLASVCVQVHTTPPDTELTGKGRMCSISSVPCVPVHVHVYTCVCVYWGWNSGPCMCQTSVLPLSPPHPPIFILRDHCIDRFLVWFVARPFPLRQFYIVMMSLHFAHTCTSPLETVCRHHVGAP